MGNVSGTRRLAQTLFLVPAAFLAVESLADTGARWTETAVESAGNPESSVQLDVGSESALRQRIGEMVDVMSRHTYGGRFMHVRGDEIELMRVVHREVEGQRAELLVAENGEVREIRRLGDRCACIWPQRGQVMLGDYPNITSRLAGERFGSIDSVSDTYRVVSLGQSRVAGESCDMMAIVPTDDYRYGYKLCIGQKTPLLLRMSIYDEVGRPIEHNQFTQVESLERVELSFQEDLVADIDSDFEMIELGGEPVENAPIRQESWVVDPLPSGYSIKSRSWRRNPVTGQYFEHLVISDGLATASVFVEEGRGEASRQASRTSQGMKIAARAVDDIRVTAIGDVPSATVEALVANTVRESGKDSEADSKSGD